LSHWTCPCGGSPSVVGGLTVCSNCFGPMSSPLTLSGEGVTNVRRAIRENGLLNSLHALWAEARDSDVPELKKVGGEVGALLEAFLWD
jgi:hypothetical protein